MSEEETDELEIGVPDDCRRQIEWREACNSAAATEEMKNRSDCTLLVHSVLYPWTSEAFWKARKLQMAFPRLVIEYHVVLISWACGRPQ